MDSDYSSDQEVSQAPNRSVIATLLSDIDAEGLTASALQSCLTKMDIRREELLMTLFAASSDIYSTAADTKLEDVDSGTLSPELSCSTALKTLLPPLPSEQTEMPTVFSHDDPESKPAIELIHLASQHAQICTSLLEAQQQAASVRRAAEIHERIVALEANIQQGQFTEAAWIAVELQHAVSASILPTSSTYLKDDASSDENADEQQEKNAEQTTDVAALPAGTSEAIESKVAPLRQQLLAFPSYCLEINKNSRIPSLKEPKDQTTTTLQNVFTASEVLGMKTEVMNAFCKVLVQHCFGPIIAGDYVGGPARPPMPLPPPPHNGASAASATTGQPPPPPIPVEKVLYKALKALCEQVLGDDQEVISAVGEHLWPAIAGVYIDIKLRRYEPNNDAQLEMFTKRGLLAQKVEQKAIKLGLTPDTPLTSPIARYVRTVTNRVLNTQKARFVARARDLLSSNAAHEAVTVVSGCIRKSGAPRALVFSDNDDPHSSETTTTTSHTLAPSLQLQQHPELSVLENLPPILDTGTCCISKAIQGVVDAMHEALIEATTSSSPALAQAMCSAVVDMASLVVAIPPSSTPTHSGMGDVQGKERKEDPMSLPYPTALRYNDLDYIHHTLCTLPYIFGPQLQTLVQPTEVDFIPAAIRVKTAANQILSAMIHRQAEELSTIAAEFERGFKGLDGAKIIKCKKAVMQLLHAFRRLGSVLKGVLTPMVLMQVAGVLMNAVCETICDIILTMSDISVEEAGQIPIILGELTSGLYNTVLPTAQNTTPSIDNNSASENNNNQNNNNEFNNEVARCREVLQSHAPCLDRLVTLCWILDARLKDIWTRWQSGQLASVGLNANQVSHLIMALFEDTDLRKEVLQQLKKARQQESGGTAKESGFVRRLGKLNDTILHSLGDHIKAAVEQR